MTNDLSLPHEKLHAYQEACKVLDAVREAQITDAHLRDQALRAATRNPGPRTSRQPLRGRAGGTRDSPCARRLRHAVRPDPPLHPARRMRPERRAYAASA